MPTPLRERTTQELPQPIQSLIHIRTADALFVVAPDYRIVYWDARAESLTGLLAEEMIGEPCYEAVQGECEGGTSFSAHLCSVMHLAQEERSAPSSYEMRLFTRSGRERWVNVSTLAVDAEEGPYLVHLVRDSQRVHETLEMAQGLIRLTTTATSASKREVPAQHYEDRRGNPSLTARQLEVLGLLSEGRSAKEIGKELYLSQATIRNHVRSLLQALGAHSQLEALAKAHKMGLLTR
jgi:PAS domain S-box-containing protein